MPEPSSVTVESERLALLGAVASGLAHELRNPLSTLAVHLQLLKEDWSTPATTKERMTLKRIEVLLREARRLEEVLSDFLRFAAGHRPTLAPCDLNDVVTETLDFFGPEAEQNGVRIESSFAEGLPKLALDRNLFKQALLNIIINGVQAMPDGGILYVTTASEPSGARISVRDTGVGIPGEIRNRLFDVYFSTKPNGTGLGLATTRRIVEEHGGTIDVESRPREGATFTLHFRAPHP